MAKAGKYRIRLRLLITPAKSVCSTGACGTTIAILYFVSVKIIHFCFDLITYPTKFTFYKFGCSFGFGWIVKTDMHTMSDFSFENRTVVISFTANCNDIIPGFVQIFIYRFRYMVTYIDTGITHRFDS